MFRVVQTRLRNTVHVVAILLLLSASLLYGADAQYLYGIHWWGYTNGQPVDQTPQTLLDVPTYSAWDLETILTHEAWWWQASYFTGLYQTLYSWNVTPITRIDYTWGDTVPAPSDPNYSSWPASVVSLVNTLYNQCHIWVIGNEPNILTGGVYWPNRRIPPADYAAIYRSVRNAIHNNAKVGAPGQHIVLLAGPSPGPPNEVRWMDGNAYLGQVLDNLSPAEVDGFAIHSYGGSVADFHNGYVSQLQVLDQKGFTDKPVWITEFNRYTSSDNDEQYTAQFARSALADVNTWNQTYGNHNIVGMTWFVYDCNQQGGGVWNGHSIEYWKDHGFPAGDARDLFTAFQQTVDLRYRAGVYGIRTVPNAWTDDFNDGVLDTSAPEPDWVVSTSNGGTVQETGGYLRLIGSSGKSSVASVMNSEYPLYDSFIINAKLYLANAGSTNGGEANAEIRFRTDPLGTGYSLSFKANDSPNVINLRRSDTWAVIQNKQVDYSLPSGTVLYIRIECKYYRIKIQVGTTPGGNDVVNWDLYDSTFTNKGCFWLLNYQMLDARFDYFSYELLPTGIQGTVRDVSGRPLGGVTVASSSGAYTTTTNPDGTYSILTMQPGVYSFTASKSGYFSQTVSGINVAYGNTTQVDFMLTDSTPPTTPVVLDDGDYQTSENSLHFSWSASDPESGIAEYEYAISQTTSPAGIISGGEWLPVGTATQHTRTGLSLANGQIYYGLVRARNPAYVWSEIGVSNGIRVAKGVSSISRAKAEPNGRMIALDDRIVTAVFNDCIYIEDPDRTSGIRVIATGLSEGTVLDLAGYLSTTNGEREISAYFVTPGGSCPVPKPLTLSNISLGGASLNAYTPGITGALGVNNIGLLVTTSGRVKSPGTGYFTISDGSLSSLKVVVPPGVTMPGTGKYTIVTGISSVEAGTARTRLLRVRKQSDIVVVD